MNKKQRLVLAIFVPTIVFFIALIIANSVGYTVIYKQSILPDEGDIFDKYKKEISGDDIFDKYAKPITYYRESNPFAWERTWYIWFLSLTFCCIFEYRLFADKKIIINKKKKDNLS